MWAFKFVSVYWTFAHELLDDAVSLAIKDYKNRNKKVFSFETNVLSNFGGAKGVKGCKGSKGKLK